MSRRRKKESILKKLDLESYIINLSKVTNLPLGEIERIIHTQVAIVVGDLAVEGSASTWLGVISVKDSELHIEPNDVVESILNKNIDPLLVLKEISQNE